MTASTSPTNSGVERACGFVEQQQVRAHHQRAHDTDALLLAARQPRRVSVPLVQQADLGQHRLGLRQHVGAGAPLGVQRGLRDVLQHRHVRPKREMLEHHADAGAQPGQLRVRHGHVAAGADADLHAAQIDLATVRTLQPVDAAQQRGLAGPGRPEHADRLPAPDIEVYAVEHGHGAEVLAQAPDTQHGGNWCRVPRRGPGRFHRRGGGRVRCRVGPHGPLDRIFPDCTAARRLCCHRRLPQRLRRHPRHRRASARAPARPTTPSTARHSTQYSPTAAMKEPNGT